jgi:ATP-dependent DNA helicase RecG
MPLPINIQDLFTGRVVEWERLEFKEGWNPEVVVRSICAFANDFHNWGGGYLVIGVAEVDGKPVLPPKGLEPEQVDAIQKKLLELSYRIRPAYHPIAVPATVQDKLILVIWVPGGDLRPYKAPVSLAKDNTEWGYYIRRHANSIEAKGQDEQELIALANKVPFDDRVNQRVSADALQPSLIQSFLSRVKSDLAATAGSRPIAEVAQAMRLLGGPPEAPFPLNVGLMFFTPEPATWFPCTQIDIVQFPKGAGGGDIIERTFTGPIDVMLRDALAYFKNNLLVQYVRKHPDQAEAERYWNLPYAAFEEVLVNAVYHRSYEEREPIEVRVLPDEILVQSFPGPDRSIPMEELRAGHPVGRRYRNRRIGEFLKELELSEGRNTGIPTIQKAMADNGSPTAQFETDEDRTFLLVRLPLRPAPKPVIDTEGLATAQVTAHVAPLVTNVLEEMARSMGLATAQVTAHVAAHVVKILRTANEPQSRDKLQVATGGSHREHFRKTYLKPLLTAGWLAPTLPDKPKSSLQKYALTKSGRQWLAKHQSLFP